MNIWKVRELTSPLFKVEGLEPPISLPMLTLCVTIRQQTALKGASISSYGTWCLLHAEVYMKSSDCDPVGMLKACCEGTMHQKFRQTKEVTALCTLCILSCHACIKNVIFTQYLPACNSRTARWRNLVLDLYCRASQELLSGSWIMRIGWSELSALLFLRGIFSSACE